MGPRSSSPCPASPGRGWVPGSAWALLARLDPGASLALLTSLDPGAGLALLGGVVMLVSLAQLMNPQVLRVEDRAYCEGSASRSGA
ncbi:MAG: hypothetical protein AB2385_16965 [Symbiobacterium sp.]|uniref:hypothetical protein n=1 Tax=Symbiobacterium sp. TaxID=1971213 RepID=UPI0034644C9C